MMNKIVKISISVVITASIGINGYLASVNSKLAHNVNTLNTVNNGLIEENYRKDYEIQKLYDLSIIGDYEVLSTKDKNWIECENLGTGQKMSLNKMYTPDWLEVGTKFYYNINEEVLPLCQN